ncbi:uncharacterized protein VDAG_04835 [Verticillium dahliae VdLs.17]|uniref:Uncharacterized protein n=1 Tax=Verticillium dahliae (strain VdLs.17 / ATCC MYA-4575 / FGSC 10137) TaxID=498257 RepID=G2X350_VERDV|nr:uncharacterized protein VDAG_04835 [Verticillium dahliae VdLs.17]EGY23397.1 hypothetical protein VDAG_04835 [Verticillium dahliae VdLs.17]
MSTTVTIPAPVIRPLEASDQNAAHQQMALGRLEAEPAQTHRSVYTGFTNVQKNSITFFVACCGLIASMSTTSILAAVPEITDTFDTTPTVISVSNAFERRAPIPEDSRQQG